MQWKIFESDVNAQSAWLVVCDFDETFMPMSGDNLKDSGIDALQTELLAMRQQGRVFFGFATGNSFEHIEQKLAACPGFPWDFALTSLGTELYWNHEGEVFKSMDWARGDSAQLESAFSAFDSALHKQGLELARQGDNFQQQNIRGYYLNSDDTAEARIAQIKALAEECGLFASITYASVAAGDPEGVYDVAIMPAGCGKQQGVAYVQQKLNVSGNRVIAFGDSCNDLEMLQAYSKGYLVANAAKEAKNSDVPVLAQKYCSGILEGILRHKADIDADGSTGPGDKPVFGIYFGAFNTYTLFFADEIGLFDLLAQQPLSLGELADKLELGERAAQSLVSMCISMDLLALRGESYTLTTVSQTFLTQNAPYSFQGVLDSARKEEEAFSYAFFKDSVLKQSSQLYDGTDLFDNNEHSAEDTKIFTRAMHSKSKGPASAWPKKLDLKAHHTLLDIGGGSGAHSIAALQSWPHLRGLVFDRPLVCEVAKEYIEQSQLSSRLSPYIGDLWKGELPDADIHFYSDIYHDWTPEQCRFLTQKSFDAMPGGGRIILHEMCFNEHKSGPANVAAYNLNMLLWTQGQQFSTQELELMLQQAGFTQVESQMTGFGDWHIVTGVKPE